MPDYRRNRVPGGTYFFTVNLLERRRRLLVEHVDVLRAAVRSVRDRHPFHIDAWVVFDAWVVLPDHLHCLWTLPPGDADYSSKRSVGKAQRAHEQSRAPRLIGAQANQSQFFLSHDCVDRSAQRLLILRSKTSQTAQHQ